MSSDFLSVTLTNLTEAYEDNTQFWLGFPETVLFFCVRGGGDFQNI